MRTLAAFAAGALTTVVVLFANDNRRDTLASKTNKRYEAERKQRHSPPASNQA